jgi:hypothetical protein
VACLLKAWQAMTPACLGKATGQLFSRPAIPQSETPLAVGGVWQTQKNQPFSRQSEPNEYFETDIGEVFEQ